MTPSEETDATIAYYNQNAGQYRQSTFDVDMRSLYGPFLQAVRPGGHILDAGCGPGRDALHFLRQGYTVSAFDASDRMAALASQVTGLPVQTARFEDLDAAECYDAVWACASLLHVPAAALDDVLERLTRALKPGGVLYISFKYGSGEEIRDGRRFNHQTEASLTARLGSHPRLQITRLWQSADVRPERSHECWLNALCQKTG